MSGVVARNEGFGGFLADMPIVWRFELFGRGSDVRADAKWIIESENIFIESKNTADK